MLATKFGSFTKMDQGIPLTNRIFKKGAGYFPAPKLSINFYRSF